MNKLLSALLLSLLMRSCEGYRHKFAGPSPAPGTVVNWPGMAYDEVRAYRHDHTAEETETFLDPRIGRMHSGVMDRKGVKLNAAQTKQLMAAITRSRSRRAAARRATSRTMRLCSSGKGHPVAVFEMCFGCNRQKSYPAGTPEYIDRQALWDLTAELGLPLGKGNAFYTEACRRKS